MHNNEKKTIKSKQKIINKEEYFDKKLINKYLLTPDEIKWIDTYHSQVFNKLKKYLSKQELEWLKSSCSPL